MGKSDIEELIAGNRRTPFEQRELILGYDVRGREIIKNPSSMLIGGPTSSGKSVVGAYMCCWIVLMDGLILPVDPHCNNPTRGLANKIAPLQDWFVREPLDFTNKAKALEQFEWLDAELLRREMPGGLNDATRMIWLVVDEFNEFLSRLSKAENKRVSTIIGNIARAGAKWGLFCLLLGHQWDLSKAGGSEIRYNVVSRVCTGGELRQMGMVLDIDDRQLLRDRWSPPIRKGDALVRMADYQLRRLRYPHVTTEKCAAIADLVRRVHGMPEKHSQEYSQERFTVDSVPPVAPERLMLPSPLIEPAEANEEFLGMFISEQERLQIVQEGLNQIQETGKVVRTKIKKRLGWDNDDGYKKIQIVCDQLGWSRSMQNDKLDPVVWEEIKQKYNYTCLKCGRRESEITLEPDRVLPGVKGGTYAPENVQPLCKACNSSKREKIIDYREEREQQP